MPGSRAPRPSAVSSSRKRDCAGDSCGRENGMTQVRDETCNALGDITNVIPSSRAQVAMKPPQHGPPPTQSLRSGEALRKSPTLPPQILAGGPAFDRSSSCAAVVDCNIKGSSQNHRSGYNGSSSPFQADSSEGVQSVAEYIPDVVNQLFQEELSYMPRSGFMDRQTEINIKMRAILVDWLVEVHQKYHLRSATLFLAINITDRYLAEADVPRKRLQLVGVVALLIAAKYEEIQPPKVSDYVYITDNAYTKSDLINMECSILATLGFRVVVPTVGQFLDVFQRAYRCDCAHQKISWYLAELAQMDPQLASQPPSLLAAASVLLSNELVGQSPSWPAGLVRLTRRTELELRHCVSDLRSALIAAQTNTLQAIRRKYTSQSNHAVARTVSVSAAP